jgi:hypothetical protein
MNVSMPPEIRQLVRQGAISTAALERQSLDDSAWIVRAVCEKLAREWSRLDVGGPMPDIVRHLGSRQVPAQSRDAEFPVRGPVAVSLAS